MGRANVLIVIIVVVPRLFLAVEVLRSLVLMCAAIISMSVDCVVDVARRELVELLVVTENDDGDIDGTKH